MKDADVPRNSADLNPGNGRNETEAERSDRNWNELLQELRVTQTGTQILFGFLLTIGFQPRFAELDQVERTIYLVLIAVAAVTTAFAIAPVAMHRGLFRQHRKEVTVQTAHVIVGCTLIGVALVLIGTVLLIFDVLVGRGPALWMAGAIGAIIVAVGVLPALLLGRSGRRREE